jgi:hypothetical protein
MIKVTAAAAALVCLAQAVPAMAASISYEETSSGTQSFGATTVYSSLPVTDTFSRTFGPSTGFLSGDGAGSTFYDDYVFTVQSATADAITVTLNSGATFDIKSLQERIYSADGNPTLPVLGTPAGMSTAWSAPTGGGSLSSQLPTTMLNPGTYVLEVRGNVDGTAGGSYAGVINLQPVPLPAALPLMLSGLGLLGGLTRKSARG